MKARDIKTDNPLTKIWAGSHDLLNDLKPRLKTAMGTDLFMQRKKSKWEREKERRGMF